MDAVQRKRLEAQRTGNLKSGAQLTVDTQTENGQQYVEIKPTDPECCVRTAIQPGYGLHHAGACRPRPDHNGGYATVGGKHANGGIGWTSLLRCRYGNWSGDKQQQQLLSLSRVGVSRDVLWRTSLLSASIPSPVLSGYRPVPLLHRPPANYHWNQYNRNVNVNVNNNYYNRYNNNNYNRNTNNNYNRNNSAQPRPANTYQGANKNNSNRPNGSNQGNYRGQSTYQGNRTGTTKNQTQVNNTSRPSSGTTGAGDDAARNPPSNTATRPSGAGKSGGNDKDGNCGTANTSGSSANRAASKHHSGKSGNTHGHKSSKSNRTGSSGSRSNTSGFVRGIFSTTIVRGCSGRATPKRRTGYGTEE